MEILYVCTVVFAVVYCVGWLIDEIVRG